MTPQTAYMARQIAAASPAERIAMLYDRAIAALREAIQAIEDGDIQRRWKANHQATQIIEAFWVTLDLDRGGEIAANLDRLYRFMLTRLMAVDLRNDPKPAREVIDLLEPLRQSWHELVSRGQGGAAPAPSDGAGTAADPARPAHEPAPDAPAARVVLSA